jgi:hypothetical protein
MSDIATWQRKFYAYLLEAAPAGAELVLPDDQKKQRESIYRHDYYERLLANMREAYPILQQAMGVSFFLQQAKAYCLTQRSRHWSLASYGASFSAFLCEQSLPGQWVDLADFEWRLNACLLAAPAWSIDWQQLADKNAAGDLYLCWQPSVSLRCYHFSVGTWWHNSVNVSGELATFEPPVRQEESILLSCRQGEACFQCLDIFEQALAASISQEVSFDLLCEELFARFGEEGEAQLMRCVQAWLQQGVLAYKR